MMKFTLNERILISTFLKKELQDSTSGSQDNIKRLNIVLKR